MSSLLSPFSIRPAKTPIEAPVTPPLKALRPSGLLRTLASRSLQLDATELRKQLACRGARRAVAILRAGLLALELLGEHCHSDLLAHELFGRAFGKRNHAVDSRGTTLEHVKQLVGSGRNGFIARIRRQPPMRLLRLW